MPRALVIPAEGEIEVRDVDGLAAIQELVGGFIEGVQFERIPGVGFINEEGKLHGLPPNFLATLLCGAKIFPSDYIAGTLVVFGGYDAEGNETAVTDETVEYVNTIVALDAAFSPGGREPAGGTRAG